MAMKACYTVLNGKIISEERGGVESRYVSDALGSTIAIEGSGGAVTDTIGYWPYGEVSIRTGSTDTPFLFLGALGYFSDSIARSYVRARYLSVQQSRWLTSDPVWMAFGDWNKYEYVTGRPTISTDATGMIGEIPSIPFSNDIATKPEAPARPSINRPPQPRKPPNPPVNPPRRPPVNPPQQPPRPPFIYRPCEMPGRGCAQEASNEIEESCGVPGGLIVLNPCGSSKTVELWTCNPPGKPTYAARKAQCCAPVFGQPDNPMNITMFRGCMAALMTEGYFCCQQPAPQL